MDEGMDFSRALSLCKTGDKIARTGWNGAGQYVVYQKGYPDGIPINQNTADATGLAEGTICKFAPYLMFCSPQDVFFPWCATQGDLLSEDWIVLR